MQPISEILAELQEEFLSLPDAFSRYSYLAELSSLLAPPEDIRDENNRYNGCQSLVWLAIESKNGHCELNGDSDTLIIRSILFLFKELLDGQDIADVLRAEFDLLSALDIAELFSPSRKVGVAGLLPEF